MTISYNNIDIMQENFEIENYLQNFKFELESLPIDEKKIENALVLSRYIIDYVRNHDKPIRSPRSLLVYIVVSYLCDFELKVGQKKYERFEAGARLVIMNEIVRTLTKKDGKRDPKGILSEARTFFAYNFIQRRLSNNFLKEIGKYVKIVVEI
jgi:hypothetical protein